MNTQTQNQRLLIYLFFTKKLNFFFYHGLETNNYMHKHTNMKSKDPSFFTKHSYHFFLKKIIHKHSHEDMQFMILIIFVKTLFTHDNYFAVSTMCKLWMQDACKSKHICTYENLSTLTPQHPHKNLNLHQLSKPRQNIAFRYKSLKKKGKSHGIEVNLLRAAGTWPKTTGIGWNRKGQ